MSRKGNSPDNGIMESFFGILKSEIFTVMRRHFSLLNNWNKLL
ncbi:IS861, transposase OrfB family protein [Streptococcus sp. oral taxon 056 str. F0418]|nr:IS861, transposase OrfB family protein [Streptococcus sp. oral taxon 056 str. F0418]